jgi:hypothetical protein
MKKQAILGADRPGLRQSPAWAIRHLPGPDQLGEGILGKLVISPPSATQGCLLSQ